MKTIKIAFSVFLAAAMFFSLLVFSVRVATAQPGQSGVELWVFMIALIGFAIFVATAIVEAKK